MCDEGKALGCCTGLVLKKNIESGINPHRDINNRKMVYLLLAMTQCGKMMFENRKHFYGSTV